MTNYERIVNMKPAELAEFLIKRDAADCWCNGCGIREYCEEYADKHGPCNCYQAHEAWLDEEADET